MIDLHTHTFFSDGELIPSELVRRAEVIGYRILNISDHVDLSNIDFVVPRIAAACVELTRLTSVTVLAGAEITHVPLEQIPDLVVRARELGARLVTVHGETLSEPVLPGTDHAAIRAGADIVAHPGLLSEDDAALAAERGVCLEISARRGHCLANGHVARVALSAGAKLVFGSDAHACDDLVSKTQAERILRGAGLSSDEVSTLWANAEALAADAVSRSTN